MSANDNARTFRDFIESPFVYRTVARKCEEDAITNKVWSRAARFQQVVGGTGAR
jgi:hypothetical protein